MLPSSMRVIVRDWLSANQVVLTGTQGTVRCASLTVSWWWPDEQ